MATKATDIDLALFQIGHLEDSSTVSSQKIAWINYDNDKGKLNIQTPVFVTETCGIPREGVYYPTDRSRAFFKLPFCELTVVLSSMSPIWKRFTSMSVALNAI